MKEIKLLENMAEQNQLLAIKILDMNINLAELAQNHKYLLIVEEGSPGGFAAHAINYLANHGHLDDGCRVRSVTLPDMFIDHDSQEGQLADVRHVLRGQIARHLLALTFRVAVPCMMYFLDTYLWFSWTTGVCSTLLTDRGINIPTFQNFLMFCFPALVFVPAAPRALQTCM